VCDLSPGTDFGEAFSLRVGSVHLDLDGRADALVEHECVDAASECIMLTLFVVVREGLLVVDGELGDERRCWVVVA